MLKQTPSMTIGPFFHYQLCGGDFGRKPVVGNVLFPESSPRIRIAGCVFDGKGKPLDDALLEVWQADSSGRYATADSPSFSGFGRASTNGADGYFFDTVKPGRVDGQSPHLNIAVFARGLMSHLFTRIYFGDEEEANASDSLLSFVESDRRKTLIASPIVSPDGRVLYTFDIHLQGSEETVFLDF